ncbi:hypothetical protein BDY21DRAFT_84331 [Lineolata rhizophorae]|uniref:Uncharacterized protein n=1 Tax=Lineolata rhizophorae TaxID=578093 RepID=A0A6A6PBQ7_9PEZI|nr:hypothetical protein BDY21DRAFT_84331 [Lineolata rhizophorae]
MCGIRRDDTTGRNRLEVRSHRRDTQSETYWEGLGRGGGGEEILAIGSCMGTLGQRAVDTNVRPCARPQPTQRGAEDGQRKLPGRPSKKRKCGVRRKHGETRKQREGRGRERERGRESPRDARDRTSARGSMRSEPRSEGSRSAQRRAGTGEFQHFCPSLVRRKGI